MEIIGGILYKRFNKYEGQYVMQFSCEPPGALDGSNASMFAPFFSWP